MIERRYITIYLETKHSKNGFGMELMTSFIKNVVQALNNSKKSYKAEIVNEQPVVN